MVYLVCEIQVVSGTGLGHPQPLIIYPQINIMMVPQTPDGVLRLEPDQKVELYCSGKGFDAPFEAKELLTATCGNHDEFMIDGYLVRFDEIRCHDPVATSADRSLDRTICGPEVTQINVGFQLFNRFIYTMEICHDETLESTRFAFYSQGRTNVAYQQFFNTPSFKIGTFYQGRDLDKLYTIQNQRVNVFSKLGSAQVSKLLDESKGLFLVPGQLAGRSEFIYEPQQRTTFNYVNTAPQWQSISVGNWPLIEEGVQKYLFLNTLHVDIYTGTFGVLEYNDEKNVPRELYMRYDDKFRVGRIPVPKFFYKIVIAKSLNRGIAFVVLNDPHAVKPDFEYRGYRLCKNISRYVTYLDWSQQNSTMGYAIACDVKDLAKSVGHLPEAATAVGVLI